MFSKYLTEKRKNKGLTQVEFVKALKSYNFSSFGSLDNVTVSRWERGVTCPSLYKQVLITRFYNDDLLDLLLSQSVEGTFHELRKIFFERYESVYSFSNRLKYSSRQSNHYQVYEFKSMSSKEVKKSINDIESVHIQFGIPDHDMFQLNFRNLIEDNRGEFRVYYNSGEKVGHYLAYYFTYDEFCRQTEQSSCTPDYTKTCNKDCYNKLVLFSSSRFFEVPNLRLYNVYRDVLTLVHNPNIEFFAIRIVTQSGYNYYSSRGFSVVTCEGESSTGELLIGGKNYRQAIMIINANRLLASDYIVALLKHYHAMNSEARQLDDSFI
ncbi:Putative transcriptional regulator [Vibrio harveyi]|uniref:helix-turn-helix domain-containing protein n=1 Tax=Vibrio harveyi TaxID=669 RepID=UPI002AD8D102|nr:helix-turn-helix transcriptional regulator [Vibrio harveyi]CAK6712246.1 Putative transcriptional regulator [Vibrio harveyi]